MRISIAIIPHSAVRKSLSLFINNVRTLDRKDFESNRKNVLMITQTSTARMISPFMADRTRFELAQPLRTGRLSRPLRYHYATYPLLTYYTTTPHRKQHRLWDGKRRRILCRHIAAQARTHAHLHHQGEHVHNHLFSHRSSRSGGQERAYKRGIAWQMSVSLSFPSQIISEGHCENSLPIFTVKEPIYSPKGISPRCIV